MSNELIVLEAARLHGPVDPEGKRWRVTLIEEGESKNKRYYSAKAIREAAPLFEGVWANVDHPTKKQKAERPEGSIGERAGWYSNVQPVYEDGKMRLDADFNVVLPWVRESMKNAFDMGRPDWTGFSINAVATGMRPRQAENGRVIQEVEGFAKVRSVDLVTSPGAGGRIRELLESESTGDEDEMPPNDNDKSTQENTGVQLSQEELARLLEEAANNAAEAASARLWAEILEAAEAEEDEEDDLPDDTAVGDGDEDDDGDGDNEYLEEAFGRLEELERQNYLAAGRNLIQEAVAAETTLPEPSRKRVQSQLTTLLERGALTAEDVVEILESEREFAAQMAQTNPGGTPAELKDRDTVSSEYYKALQGMVAGEPVDNVRPFMSIKEAYMAHPSNAGRGWTQVSGSEVFNAIRDTNYDSGVNDSLEIQESIERATFGMLVADVMHQQLTKIYSELPYDEWRKLVTRTQSVPDFRDQHWHRMGMYDNVPAVSEGAPYQPLTSPTDEEATYRIAKYGGLEDVTLEAVANDNLGQLQRIPGAMAYAVQRTLYEAVMDAITTGGLTTAVTYDNKALYHADHANLSTLDATPFTPAGINTVQVAMRLQKPYGAPATEFMGPRNKIKYVIVNPNMEQRARAIFSPSDQFVPRLTAGYDSSGDPGRDLDAYAGIDPRAWAGKAEVLVYDKLSAAGNNHVYFVADPKMVDTLVVGFLNGRQSPELFVQDAATRAGAAFSSDKVTYKVRLFWGWGALEHRGVYCLRLT